MRGYQKETARHGKDTAVATGKNLAVSFRLYLRGCRSGLKTGEPLGDPYRGDLLGSS